MLTNPSQELNFNSAYNKGVSLLFEALTGSQELGVMRANNMMDH